MKSLKMILSKNLALGLVALGALLLASCSSENDNVNNLSGFGCTATAVVTGNSLNTTFQIANLQVTISNGTGPYALTLPGLNPITLPFGQFFYSNPGTLQLTEVPQVTVTDTQNGASTVCTIENISGGGSSGNGNLFGSSGSGNQGNPPALPPAPSFPTCTLESLPGSSFPKNTALPFSVRAASGEPLLITAINAQQFAGMPASFSLSYSTVGIKTLKVWAVSAVTRLPCNGNATIPLQKTFNIY